MDIHISSSRYTGPTCYRHLSNPRLAAHIQLSNQSCRRYAKGQICGISRSTNQLARGELHRDRRRSEVITAFASDKDPSNRLPTQGESIVRGIGDDDQYGVQVMERSKPPADIDYLAVRLQRLILHLHIYGRNCVEIHV